MVEFQEPPAVSFEGQGQDSYYLQGSQDLATETALTLNRLEARRNLTKNSERLVLVLVGLPARGKSFLARKLSGFLKWHGVDCKVFNVGKYRRQVETSSSSADFFDPKNKQGMAMREKAAELALLDMLDWLDEGDDDDDDDGGYHHKLNPEMFKSERCARVDSSSILDTLGENKNLPMEDEASMSSSSSSSSSSSGESSRRERIAIFDATNSTHKRRQWVLEQCTSPEKRGADKPTGCVFIESLCDDEELLMENFQQKIANSPDYSGVSHEDAIADLKKRVQKYEEQYETIEDDNLSYIKIFNLSTKMLVNHIYGRMSKIIMPAMMAWNIGTRPIFLCRPGQTLGNITTDGEDYVARVEDDKDFNVSRMSLNTKRNFLKGYHLGREGIRFSEALLEFCRAEGTLFLEKRASIMDLKNTGTSKTGLANPEFGKTRAFPLMVYTSTMPRATETVQWDLAHTLDLEELSNLNPLDKGDFSGKELEEIRRSDPSFYRKLEKDAFYTRFPGGESYSDLTKRLDSVVVDLEQQVAPTLVVSHVSVLQMLIAYFRNSPVEECMDIDIPLHTVIKFTPARGGGWSETVHPLVPAPTAQQ